MSTESDQRPARSPNQQNVAVQGSVVASMTMLSRISGFARDMVLSYFFGASAYADAFFVAFRIPNFFRRLFAEGAFNQAFVPVLARFAGAAESGDRQHPEPAGRRALEDFIAVITGNLGAVLVVVVLVGIIGAPVLISVFAPGFWGDDVRFTLATDMVRITFPYLAFISLTALAGAIQNSHHHYAIPAFTPVLLNLSLITAMLFATGITAEPVYALAWGVLVAGIVQLLFQFPALARLDLIVRPRISFKHPGAREVGVLLLPAVFAASVNQINALIDTILASMLVTGSISWLYYADRLLELPVGLVAVALGTVLLPNLSRLDAAGDRAAFSATLDWGVRMGLLLGLPAAAALYLLATPLIGTLFFHGAMTAHDARMAALALQAFAVGLPALVLVKVLAPAYFARKDTATPFRFGVAAVLVNVALNLALFSWMGHLGLALATSAAGWVNAMLLLRGVLGSGHYRPDQRTLIVLVRVFAATLFMAFALKTFLVPADAEWLAQTAATRAGWLLMVVAGGAGIFLLSVLALGERPKALLHRV